MRPRKKPNLQKRMTAAGAVLVGDPSAARGRWRELFGAPPDAALHVELGPGKGGFICEIAKQNPDVLYVGIEKVPDVLVMAMERALAENATNVRFIRGDAALLAEYFEPGEFSRLYINFCDPWHKNRQAKRRLTHRNFLRLYAPLLGVGGDIRFKTDNRPLFDFSLVEFGECGYGLTEVTFDLYAEDAPWNIVTEYERTFSAKGFKINRLVATVSGDTLETCQSAGEGLESDKTGPDEQGT
ncbi:MAG TPA: tRNA (guanosine(46)-N7)-methyltransferase TrmB [Terriglobales bacterium]|nr:tRNA (guanosine(46)-N7)-methyltransferase TrmB [Terriglobales bacterium]